MIYREMTLLHEAIRMNCVDYLNFSKNKKKSYYTISKIDVCFLLVCGYVKFELKA